MWRIHQMWALKYSIKVWFPTAKSVVCCCCCDSDVAHQRPCVCCNVIWLGASSLQCSIQVQSQRPAVQWLTFTTWPLHPSTLRSCARPTALSCTDSTVLTTTAGPKMRLLCIDRRDSCVCELPALTGSSSPSMCSTTVLALLLLEPRKKWALRLQEAAAASACSASSLPADCKIS